MVRVHSLDRAGGRARRIVVAFVAFVASLAALTVAVAMTVVLPAGAATPNRAAIVVEVDGVIHTAKVTFSSDSITGLDALRGAGFDPLVRVFGGNGGAVCALKVDSTTIGCPADGTCLTCDEPRYWAYFRAPAGTTRYTYSVTGAGLTHVHDGDVEAWVWGTGSPPSRFVSFADVWGPDPTTTTRPPATTPTTRRPPPTTIGNLGTVTTTAAGPIPLSAPTRTAGTTAPTTTLRPKATSTTAATANDRAVAKRDDARKVATAPVVARGNGGSPYGLVGFAAVLAALLGAIVVARRRRSAPAEIRR